MNQKTKKITAKIEKHKTGKGFWLIITSDNEFKSTAWLITEDEIPAILNACIDYLDDNARTATYRANPELAELCVWCGKTYEEHRNEPLPSGAVPKMPCKGLKQYFVKKDKK